MNFSISKGTLAAAAAALAQCAATTSASAHRWHKGKHLNSHSAAVPVSHTRAYAPGYRTWRAYRGPVVVDAPTTYVKTGYRRRVAVDAPLTAVRVHRRGVWVRAPFVNLWVPR